MNTWLEIEQTYITDQPAQWIGWGKNAKCIPRDDVEPKKAWFLAKRCTQVKRGVKRVREVVTIEGNNRADLERRIEEFVLRDDVVVADQSNEVQS